MNTVTAMYKAAWMVSYDERRDIRVFDVKVRSHQGSVLSSLLTVTVIDVTKELREGLPWEFE